jgi:16S rRNA (guanine966-N2)-methyltransferase
MRIIAGEFRGRRLLPPEGEATRPVTDRVKQSLFDILAPLIPEAGVYDCFAGTGSMGLECLSRGARQTAFFEADRSALARLKQNIAALGVSDRSLIIGGDLFKWFDSREDASVLRADLVFLDPPYRFLRERADDLRRLARHLARRVAPDAIVIFRHDGADHLDLPPLEVYDERAYGGMKLEFLHRPT